MAAKKKLYAIYKGEDFLDSGTLDELSERQGIKINTLRFMSTPSYFKRHENGNNYLVVTCLDEYAEDEQ